LHHSKLGKEDIQPVVDKILKKAAGWREKLLNHDAKLDLVRSVLASIPLYLLSVIKFPKFDITLINSQMAHCLWDNCNGHHKYHLANKGLVTQKKEYGGLGIPNLSEMNMCLLASWTKRYNLNENKLWKQIVDIKYNINNPNIFSFNSTGASHFWKGVLWAAKAAKMGYQWKVEMVNK
jgi:hypothetical protein